ncbi:MAG TPA: hypothetical protein VHE81_02195 [Lacipirellulaceae bacterium]|nr:hypothetical protein [Lacipirellulaceae bacterium]
MKSPLLRRIVLAICVTLPAICAGCNRHAADATHTPTAKPTPEERFKRVVESFRRRVEEPQIGFVVSAGDTRSTMFGTNKVTYKLTPPTAGDDHYKAVITVVRESHYSLRQTKSSADSVDHDQNSRNQGTSLLDDPSEKKGIDILGSDLAGSKAHSDNSQSTPTSPDSSEEVVRRQPDREERNFQLVYNDDRWVLLTKTDPKTEKSIQFAFDEALASQ